MIELSQQKPDPRNFPGYRPLVPQVLSKRLGNSSAALVAAVVGLGLVIGVSMGLQADSGAGRLRCHHSLASQPGRQEQEDRSSHFVVAQGHRQLHQEVHRGP